MKRWESVVEQKIREAMARGEFDNLSGKGARVDLSENPFEDPDWRTAHRLLRNAGFAPAWIEERKDIEAELESARIQLAKVWRIMQNARRTENERGAATRWANAQESFKQALTQLNRRIAVWNLKVPAVGFQLKQADIDRELESIARGNGT